MSEILEDEIKTKRNLGPKKVVLSLIAIFFFLFFFTASFFYWAENTLRQNSAIKGGSVGLLEIEGIILDSRRILKKLEELEKNNQVRALVIRLNSPGGSVAPSQEIYEAVKRYSKPTVVSMSSVAASGALYIAMGAQKIIANPGSLTGSIGVIMEFTNLERLYEWAKIQHYAVKTGKYKDTGSDYRGMTSEEKQLFQKIADDILDQFKEAIIQSRKLSREQVSRIADGRVFSGRQALDLKLVDELGTLKDAILIAGQLGGIQGEPHVFEIKKRKNWMQFFLEESEEGFQEEATGRSSLSSLVGRAILSLLKTVGKERGFSQEDFSPGPLLLFR